MKTVKKKKENLQASVSNVRNVETKGFSLTCMTRHLSLGVF